MCVPEKFQAITILEQAGKLNPGHWVDHCKVTAECAINIANKCKDMDSDKAYVYGLLHDIGRRSGTVEFAHIIKGYEYLKSLGYSDATRICVTHSFPAKNIKSYHDPIDCEDNELNFVKEFISNHKYDDYDKLVQLCDVLSLSDGFCLLEKRMVKIGLSYGLKEIYAQRWRMLFNLKEYFDKLAGVNIYTLLPGIVENTFDFK